MFMAAACKSLKSFYFWENYKHGQAKNNCDYFSFHRPKVCLKIYLSDSVLVQLETYNV